LTDDAFQDKVQSEFEQVYQQKRSGSPAWTFFSHADDKNGKNVEYKKDTESKALYLQGETPKAKDIVDGPKDGAKTEVNAKALAQKIYDVLNSDSKMSDLIKARYAQIQVNYKGDKWAFNVDVYKEKESSSSSTEKSSLVSFSPVSWLRELDLVLSITGEHTIWIVLYLARFTNTQVL